MYVYVNPIIKLECVVDSTKIKSEMTKDIKIIEILTSSTKCSKNGKSIKLELCFDNFPKDLKNLFNEYHQMNHPTLGLDEIIICKTYYHGEFSGVCMVFKFKNQTFNYNIFSREYNDEMEALYSKSEGNMLMRRILKFMDKVRINDFQMNVVQ